MLLEVFLARKLIIGADGKHLLSRPAVIIAVITVMLGVAAMSLSVMIVGGFKKNISEKLTGFSAHLLISRFDLNKSFEAVPIERDTAFEKNVLKLKGVRSVYPMAYKNGIIKTDDEVQGIVLKGVDATFYNSGFLQSMVDGKISLEPKTGKQPAIISRKLSSLLHKKTGDELLIYFIQDPPRVRKMLITGVYDTDMEEFDKLYVFCPLSMIQKLNGWNLNQFTGYETELTSFSEIGRIKADMNEWIPPTWRVESIYDLFPQIFNWLQLVDVNTIIIITLIVAVAVINLMIVLLILILEQSFFTGVLKTIGAGDAILRKVFILITGYILFIGMASGNLLAGLIAFLQYRFQWITLPEDSYYMSVMPVSFNPANLILINAGMVAVALLVLIIPSAIIRNIRPVSVLRFD
jgi:lipoprotein-releasing system permease protein